MSDEPFNEGLQSILSPPSSSYFDALNPEQRKAVETIDGPLLVLAGAGTGKTRVLTTRLAHILASGHAQPWQVLAVTFTNKAAAEMRERVSQLLQRSSDGMWIGTFHSTAVRILRRNAEHLGYESNFTILDMDDQKRLLKQLIKQENIDEKKYPAKMMGIIISRWKDMGFLPENVPVGENPMVEKIYALYQAQLRLLNTMDFGDLLLLCTSLFERHPEVLEHYHRQFRYIMVDEYQDTNVVQYLWLRYLAQSNNNICCVGDDDQSIYGWRGAEVGNILRFEHDFPGAHIIRLEQNYRSTFHILGAASGLIKHNKERLGKTLWTDMRGGEKVHVCRSDDGPDEARMIGNMVESLYQKDVPLREMAVLVRASFQTREFEERFLYLGIPYRVIGGLRFYERLEIRDAIAYFRLVIQPRDSLAFERIINTPKRGVGASALQKIHAHAREHGASLSMAAEDLLNKGAFSGKVQTSLNLFFKYLGRWREQLSSVSHVELAQIILEESGYTTMWQTDKSPEAPSRLENLKELVKALDGFPSLQAFLEHVSLVMDAMQESKNDMVSIMTLHASKGLEFDTVFLCGWEEGLFPHSRSLNEALDEGLEEERRLAYVGITRGRKRAIITFADRRRMYQQYQQVFPSRFLRELPVDHVDFLTQRDVARAYPISRHGQRF